MILYHHTDPAYLPSIMEVGLLARPWGYDLDNSPEDRATLSAILHHRSVVWLTTQSSTSLTKADIAVLRQHGGRDKMIASGLWLERNGGKLVALKVDIPKHSKKLARFLAWVKKNEAVILDENGVARCNDAGELWTTASAVSDYIPAGAQWYIHFGDIPPKRITVPKH